MNEPRIVCHLKRQIFQWQADNNQRLTFETLANETGVADRTLRRWANNEVSAYDASVIVKLCVFFGIGVGDLLEFSQAESE